MLRYIYNWRSFQEGRIWDYFRTREHRQMTVIKLNYETVSVVITNAYHWQNQYKVWGDLLGNKISNIKIEWRRKSHTFLWGGKMKKWSKMYGYVGMKSSSSLFWRSDWNQIWDGSTNVFLSQLSLSRAHPVTTVKTLRAFSYGESSLGYRRICLSL